MYDVESVDCGDLIGTADVAPSYFSAGSELMVRLHFGGVWSRLSMQSRGPTIET